MEMKVTTVKVAEEWGDEWGGDGHFGLRNFVNYEILLNGQPTGWQVTRKGTDIPEIMNGNTEDYSEPFGDWAYLDANDLRGGLPAARRVFCEQLRKWGKALNGDSYTVDVELPIRWVDDAQARDIEMGTEVARTARTVTMRMTEEQRQEALSDAEFYSDPFGPAAEIPTLIGLRWSSHAAVRYLREAAQQ